MKITQKNTKNFLLTILACLSGVHTTHAVERMSKATQKVDSEPMDKLRVRVVFQQRRYTNVCTSDAVQTGDLAIAKDALDQYWDAKMAMVAHTKDRLQPNSPDWYAADALYSGVRDMRNSVHSLPATVLTDSHQCDFLNMIEAKIQELFETGKIQGLEASLQKIRAAGTIKRCYTSALCWAYPDLEPCFQFNMPYTYPHPPVKLGHDYTPVPEPMHLHSLARRATVYDAQIDDLERKYPDIATQIVDWEKMMWKRDLIRRIKNDTLGAPQILGKFLESLGASDSKIAQEAWNTILNTLRHSLIGEDQDLAEKTKTLLANDGVLTQMVFEGPEMKKMLADSKLRSMRRMDHFKKYANFANARGLEELLVKTPLLTEHIAREM